MSFSFSGLLVLNPMLYILLLCNTICQQKNRFKFIVFGIISEQQGLLSLVILCICPSLSDEMTKNYYHEGMPISFEVKGGSCLRGGTEPEKDWIHAEED